MTLLVNLVLLNKMYLYSKKQENFKFSRMCSLREISPSYEFPKKIDILIHGYSLAGYDVITIWTKSRFEKVFFRAWKLGVFWGVYASAYLLHIFMMYVCITPLQKEISSFSRYIFFLKSYSCDRMKSVFLLIPQT